MDLGSTQPLTEMRNISWGKGARCVGLTTLPPSCADCLEIWVPQPPGTLWACPGLYWDCFIMQLNTEYPAVSKDNFNPLNAELNPICHLLALLGAHHILHVSRIRVNP